MSYAQVTDNAITETRGRLPNSARRLDTGEWVMGLATAPLALQQATGWYEVAKVDPPAEKPGSVFEKSVVVDKGTVTEKWTERAKTADELAQDTRNANLTTIDANLVSDLTALQATIDATNASINANPAAHIKTIARAQRRQIKKQLGGSNLDTAT
jgi:hypothetical protein